MTDFDAFPPSNDDWIDRIVDGTLTPAELRAAVERLDRDPAGWKCCAVAFLEAQCWREALRSPDEPARISVEDRSMPVPLLAAAPKQRRHRWLRNAVAAGVLCTSFALGWLGHAARPATSTRSVTTLVPGPILTHSPPEIETEPERAPEIDPMRSTASESRPVTGDRAPRLPVPRVTTVARLRFGADNAHAEVPIVAGPGIDEEWLRRQPLPVSEHGQVVFQRHGYQVDQRRCLISAIMADGRRVAVPVDQILIHYTGNQSL